MSRKDEILKKIKEHHNKENGVLHNVRDIKPRHNDWGEAWVMCRDCGARLYSTDGTEDYNVRCPTKKECEEDNSY